MKKIPTIIIVLTMMLIISLPLMAEEPETHRAVYLGGNDFFVESLDYNPRSTSAPPPPITIYEISQTLFLNQVKYMI